MRKSIAIIITSILVLSGCNKQQSVSDRLLNEVEKAIAINPDSASNLLKSISSPEKLDDKAFARWCMLSGKITDEIFNSILPTYQLERAYDWYSVSTHCMVLVYPISQLYLCTELKILFLWTLLIVF